MSLEGTLHQSITLLEKRKYINNRKETMPIDRHIRSSKVIVNSHPLLMAHDLCMFMYRIDMARRYSLGGKHGKQTIIPIRHGLHMIMYRKIVGQ